MSDALNAIRTAGITISVDGGNLVAHPRAALTDELRGLIRANKGGLMAELMAVPAETTAVAREREMLKEYFEELVATLSTAGVAEPEREAAKLAATCARNARFLWGSLRSALEGRPELLAQLPEGRGVVDSLPLGPASVVVRRGTVVRQGDGV